MAASHIAAHLVTGKVKYVSGFDFLPRLIIAWVEMKYPHLSFVNVDIIPTTGISTCLFLDHLDSPLADGPAGVATELLRQSGLLQSNLGEIDTDVLDAFPDCKKLVDWYNLCIHPFQQSDNTWFSNVCNQIMFPVLNTLSDDIRMKPLIKKFEIRYGDLALILVPLEALTIDQIRFWIYNDSVLGPRSKEPSFSLGNCGSLRISNHNHLNPRVEFYLTPKFKSSHLPPPNTPEPTQHFWHHLRLSLAERTEIPQLVAWAQSTDRNRHNHAEQMIINFINAPQLNAPVQLTIFSLLITCDSCTRSIGILQYQRQDIELFGICWLPPPSADHTYFSSAEEVLINYDIGSVCTDANSSIQAKKITYQFD